VKLRRVERAETVSQAVKLLTPSLERQEECCAAIEASLDICDRITKSRLELRQRDSKSTKRAVKQFAAALKRLRIAANNLPPWFSVVWASGTFYEFMVGADELAEHIAAGRLVRVLS